MPVARRSQPTPEGGAGSVSPQAVDRYYWFTYLIWQTARGETQTEDHALKNSTLMGAIAILISLISIAISIMY